jgi:hypothetical protein
MANRIVVCAGALLACVSVAPPSDADAARPVAAAITAAAAASADAPPGTAADTSGLGPTTAPPWNPDAAVSGSSGWETALRAPGRLLSLPLVGLGALGRQSLMVVEENSIVPRANFFLSLLPTYGIGLAPASLGDRTGLGGALVLAQPPSHPWVRAELSASTGHYNRTRIASFFGPASVEYRYDWRPTDSFYGLGLDSDERNGAAYAAQLEQVRGALEWPGPRPGARPPRIRLSGWAGPRSLAMRAGRVVREGDEGSGDFDFNDRALADVFPVLAATLQDVPVEHLVYGGRVIADYRSGRPHWTQGVRLDGSVERYDRPIEALALHSARPTGRPFTRTTLEAEAGFSFWRDPRTFRLLVRAIDQDLASWTGVVLLPDLMRLGGSIGLWGFQPHRFQDSDLVLGRLTYLFPLAQHFEFDLHVEAGGVYSDVWEQPTIAGLRTSWGAAIRPRTKFAPLGFFGVDVSHESVRIRYTIGGVE